MGIAEVVTIAVAAIAAVASVLVGAIRAHAARSASTTSSVVELARVEAEAERLREANHEAERRNRQKTYQQFIGAFNRMYNALGIEMNREQVNEICNQYLDPLQDVVLFGAADVSASALAVNDIYEKIWPALDRLEKEFPRKSFAECWREATEPIQDELKEAAGELISPIRNDVTRGTTDNDPACGLRTRAIWPSQGVAGQRLRHSLRSGWVNVASASWLEGR